jgi:hypothetical protein
MNGVIGVQLQMRLVDIQRDELARCIAKFGHFHPLVKERKARLREAEARLLERVRESTGGQP